MTHLPEDVLQSLCASGDIFNFADAVQATRRYLQSAIADSVLSRVLHRTALDDRFPIFGKDGKNEFLTRKLVGYNDPRKRITVPTFDVSANPAVPYRYFRLKDTGKIRRVLEESVEAIKECQTEYVYSLLQACGCYNPFYPLMWTKDPLTKDFLLRAVEPMQAIGMEPVAVFMSREDYSDETAKAAAGMGIELVYAAGYNGDVADDRSYYVFAQPTDPELCSGHIVDNRTEFTIESSNPGTLRDKERVKLQIVQNGGFVIGKASTLKIGRVWEGKPPKPAKKPEGRRISAYVVGEEGGSIVCNVD